VATVSLTLPADVQVLAYFGLPTQGGVDSFILDDPVQGRLDEPGYFLVADNATDITDWCISASVSRGRRTELDQNVPAGTASITLDNSDRDFDPLFSGPFAGRIVPGTRVRLLAAGQPIFDGTIEDWDFTYSNGRSARALIKAVDSLGLLARRWMTAHTYAPTQTAAQRIVQVLNRADVRFPASRDIAPGFSILQGGSLPFGVNALEHLQAVARSDVGVIFAAADGTLTYRDARSAYNPTSKLNFSDQPDPEVDADIDGIEVQFGSEQLFNRVQVEREGGVGQVASDLSSIIRYGLRTLSNSGLLVNADDQAAEIAEFLLPNYKSPEYRFAKVSSDSHLLEPSVRAAVVALDLQDVIRVMWAPSGVGDQVQRYATVLGIEHAITRDAHRVTLHLGSADQSSYLTLDDPVFGRLDENRVLPLAPTTNWLVLNNSTYGELGANRLSRNL
jgi:hypothetical protein